MKYLLLIYEDDADRVDKMDERMPHCSAYAQAMLKAGIYVCGERLRGVAAATTVRLAGGRTQVVDGPYAEAREQLGLDAGLVALAQDRLQRAEVEIRAAGGRRERFGVAVVEGQRLIGERLVDHAAARRDAIERLRRL